MSEMKNLAIEELNALNDKFIEEMRSSEAYRAGYLGSAVRTAIWYLELGKPKQALENLKATAKIMQVKL